MKHILSISVLTLLSFGLSGQTKETDPDYLLRLHGPWSTYESDNYNFYYRENPTVTNNNI